MKFFSLSLCLITALGMGLPAMAQGADPAGATPAAGVDRTTQAAAAVTAARPAAVDQPPDFLEHVVDSVLGLFDLRTSGNTVTHFVISAVLLVIALLARRIVTGVLFVLLRKVAAKTVSTLDDKIFSALEAPVAAFVMVTGIFAALKVLKLSPETDLYLSSGSRVAFSLATFWILWRALGALFDHGHEIATTRKLGVAAFMPWIRKSLMSVFIVLGVLMTIQSMGYDVKTILAGLGIGGLAFALAAQDTLANIFGAVVVAIDQPFRVGEFIRIGGDVGGVEDIGLRSTRIRLIDKSLMIIPNKTVAGETITNLGRFTQRRCEQVIGLTYDTKPEQMAEMVEEIRRIIVAEEGVDPTTVMVFFRDFSASSLDIWVVYVSRAPDFLPFMEMRQRINMAIMRSVEARGLSFAFPTQTLHLAGEIAGRMAVRNQPPAV
jgi:MscS family membrane protein